MKKLKFLSLFSGIGSPESALKRLNIPFELIGFSEIDKYAIESYCKVHNVSKELNLGDITQIDIESLPADIDLITHGSPCQDFSVAGKGAGGDEGTGTRSSLMWNTVAICKHCKPKFVIWENVKNVLSAKHKHNFDKYMSEMEAIGYNNYYKVLNAKDFGIPQNRERVFVVSIRKDLNKDFEFPEGYDNGVRLKDLLEDEVDEKYYISEEKTQQLIKNCKGVIDFNKQVVGACHKRKVIIPCMSPDRVNKKQNGRRFKENDDSMFTITSQDRHGILQIGKLDIKGNDQMKRVYDAEGISPCLSTMQGGNRQPKIIEEKQFKVKEATKKGYAIATEGDSINLEQPNSKTRRGRVGKEIANTLTTSCNQATVQNYRIRKLTPLECWRLMGFEDEQFKRAEEVCSNSQLYKQAGNSIVVDVMVEILKKLLLESNEELKEEAEQMNLFTESKKETKENEVLLYAINLLKDVISKLEDKLKE